LTRLPIISRDFITILSGTLISFPNKYGTLLIELKYILQTLLIELKYILQTCGQLSWTTPPSLAAFGMTAKGAGGALK
jgi:hypothetical protein